MSLDAPTAALFGALARLRGGRHALHPRGRTHAGTLDLGPGAPPPLGPGRRVDVVVRLSRAVGLPPPLPDVHGVAIRLPDHLGPGRHQDLLLSATWGRHVLRPARRLRGELSTILPFEHAGRRFVIGLLARGDGRFALVSARPGRRWGATSRGSRPASASARRSSSSTWALTDRRSSAAHRASASCTAGSSRSSTCLRSRRAGRCPPGAGAPASSLTRTGCRC